MLDARYLDDFLELSDLSEGGGAIIRCYRNGRIELVEIPLYGGMEIPYGNYPTVCAALDEAATWT